MPNVIPLHQPGQAVPGRADGADVIGGRFVKVAGPVVVEFPNGDPVKIEHAAAATDATIGVALQDAADGKVTAIATHGYVVPVTCSAAIAAGEFVTVAADGKAVSVAARDTAVGVAWSTTTAANQNVFVQLY